MGAFNSESDPNSIEGLFDDDFWIAAYHTEDDRLVGVDLVLRRDERRFLLSVESMELHTERIFSLTDTEREEEDRTYVLPGGEILFEDLAIIKQKPTAELMSYLVEQADE